MCFFISSLTKLARTLRFEFRFLEYKGARNLIQSVLKQAEPQNCKEFFRCLLYPRGGGIHTMGTCPCLEAEQGAPSLGK